MKFDHIGIVVETMAAGRALLSTAFGVVLWTAEFEDPINGVFVQFGRDASGVCYETIAPLSDRSPVSRALRTGANLINHVAYLVDDLDAQARRLEQSGFVKTGDPKPAIAYGGRNIQFFFSPNRMLFELIEAPDHQHSYIDKTKIS